MKSPAGEKPVALKAFDLKTGAGKGSWPLPGEKSLCNDMVVGADGSVYVSDIVPAAHPEACAGRDLA